MLYICFLKWPPQHRYGNSNLVRFGMNTTTRQTRIPKLFLTAQTVNPPRFPLHVPNESIADCRKLPPCGNYQHSVITVKIPFISLYSKIYTSPDVVLKKARLEVQKRVLISIA